MYHKLLRVISGGQTGIDQIGLMIAKELNIPTGGTAPARYRTDVGSNFSLRDVYGLSESPFYSYPPRTEENVKNSDGTLLLGNMNSPGCKLTIRLCKKHGKPFFVNPANEINLVSFINAHTIRILNVAGNRERSLSQQQLGQYRMLLHSAFKYFV